MNPADPCVMHSLELHPFGDYFALEAWCATAGLRLVCHQSMRFLLGRHTPVEPRDAAVAACRARILQTRYYSSDELLEEFGEDASVLWLSSATSISGMLLPERYYVPSADRWAAVAGFSALSGAYGGISLYKWIAPKFAHQNISLKGGRLLDLK